MYKNILLAVAASVLLCVALYSTSVSAEAKVEKHHESGVHHEETLHLEKRQVNFEQKVRPCKDLRIKIKKKFYSKGRVQGKQPGKAKAGADTTTTTQAPPVDRNITNVAEFYSDQYPAMFNIIFWTSLILAFAVFSISYSMWSMDPGLDTVIYRMTSQRIKKEN
jgi:hypothetical protein